MPKTDQAEAKDASTMRMGVHGHGPFKVRLFTESECERIVQDLDLRKQGLLHEQEHAVLPWLQRIHDVTGIEVDTNTFKVRNNPGLADGLGPHLDMDYMLRIARAKEDRDTCISCGKAAKGGLHLRKACNPPSCPRAFTIAVNIGSNDSSFLSFGKRAGCVSKSRKGDYIPRTGDLCTTPYLLRPGEAVVFSVWVLHNSNPECLGTPRLSLDMRGWLKEAATGIEVETPTRMQT